MILVIRNSKVIAYHSDDQEYVIDHYPVDCEIIRVADNVVEFSLSEDGATNMPEDPRPKGVPYTDLRKQGTAEQRIADLETALAALLGGGA